MSTNENKASQERIDGPRNPSVAISNPPVNTCVAAVEGMVRIEGVATDVDSVNVAIEDNASDVADSENAMPVDFFDSATGEWYSDVGLARIGTEQECTSMQSAAENFVAAFGEVRDGEDVASSVRSFFGHDTEG